MLQETDVCDVLNSAHARCQTSQLQMALDFDQQQTGPIINYPIRILKGISSLIEIRDPLFADEPWGAWSDIGRMNAISRDGSRTWLQEIIEECIPERKRLLRA